MVLGSSAFVEPGVSLKTKVTLLSSSSLSMAEKGRPALDMKPSKGPIRPSLMRMAASSVSRRRPAKDLPMRKLPDLVW